MKAVTSHCLFPISSSILINTEFHFREQGLLACQVAPYSISISSRNHSNSILFFIHKWSLKLWQINKYNYFVKLLLYGQLQSELNQTYPRSKKSYSFQPQQIKREVAVDLVLTNQGLSKSEAPNGSSETLNLPLNSQQPYLLP